MLNAPTRSALNILFNLAHLNSPRLILSPHPSPWIGHLDDVYASSTGGGDGSSAGIELRGGSNGVAPVKGV